MQERVKRMKKENKRYILKTIGRAAADWRRKQGIRQRDIAVELETTFTNISAFESGNNDSAIIFLWYVLHGFDPLESDDVWQLLKN